MPLKIAKQPNIPEKDFFDFLRQRKEHLEGVVVCGGEPTVNKDLPQFILKIKNMGYAVKLDTNGSNPKMLKELIETNLIDYVAMDIKGPMGPNSQFSIFNFQKILGEGVKMEDIQKSVEILKKGNVDFEFRTTVVPGVHKKEDFSEIAKWIGGENVKYYLQGFRPFKTIDPQFENVRPFEDAFIKQIAEEISPKFKICLAR